MPQTLLIVKSPAQIKLPAGVGAVRITWITAMVVCLFAIIVGLLSGGDDRNSSRYLPGFAFTEGADPSQQPPDLVSFDPISGLAASAGEKVRENPQKRTETGTTLADRSPAADQHGSDDSQSRARVPDRPERSGSNQTERAGDGGPSSSPDASLPRLPSVNPPSVDPPSLPQEPSASPPSVSEAPSASLPSSSETGVSVNVSSPVASVSASLPVETTATDDVSVKLP